MKRFWFFLLALTLPLAAQTYQPTWGSIDSRPTPAWFEDFKSHLLFEYL